MLRYKKQIFKQKPVHFPVQKEISYEKHYYR